MSAGAVALTPGTRLIYDGDLVEVMELDGARAVVRNHRTARFVTVKLGGLVAGARPDLGIGEPLTRAPPPGLLRPSEPARTGAGRHRPGRRQPPHHHQEASHR